jgi:hypothetical protein
MFSRLRTPSVRLAKDAGAASMGSAGGEPTECSGYRIPPRDTVQDGELLPEQDEE